MAQKFELDYTVLDNEYQNGSLRVITGDDAGTDGNFGSIQNPLNTGIDTVPPPPVDPSLSKDPVIFSYLKGTELRGLLGKIVTARPPASPSECYYSVYTPLVAAEATDVVLQSPAGTNMATNPHGVAQIGDLLYIIDYDSQKITILGTTELDGKSGNYSLAKEPFDLATKIDDFPTDAKGQAIIALKDNSEKTYLFALYLVSDDTDYPPTFYPSILVRLNVAGDGSLSYGGDGNWVYVGKNATEIIPVEDSNAAGGITLLIPAIGGPQRGGFTNGKDSDISAVPVSGDWPYAGDVAPELLTGDTATVPPTAYDIRAIAAPMPGNTKTDTLYILTATYNTDAFTGIDWRLYSTSISKLLGAGGITITDMINAGNLSIVDGGTAIATSYAGIYFWDLLYENGTGTNADRLWFAIGSPILVTLVNAYGSPSKPGNPYKFFDRGTAPDQIGNLNVNSADLLAETIRQIVVGHSLKRGLRSHLHPTVRAAMLKAATRGATARSISVEEEK
jgi:hypothetical protein